MNFKNWLLSEEIFPNKTATVYHRTKDLSTVSKILSSGFKAGEGCTYGCGLYTTFALESQFKSYMSGYGDYIVKFKVTDLDKYLICQLSTAKYILGNDYSISSQFKKFNIQADPNQLKEYDYVQEKIVYSSDLAIDIYSDHHEITSKCKGIIFRGQNDGYVLVKYEPVNDGTINMLGYSEAEVKDLLKMRNLQNNKEWITQTKQAKISQIEKLPEKRKEEFAQLNKNPNEAIQELISKNEVSKIISILKNNNYFELNFKKSNLPQNKINQLGKLILKYKKDLNSEDVTEVLSHVSNPSTISDNIKELVSSFDLSDLEIYNILNNSNFKEEVANIIGEEKIKDLKGYWVYSLLQYSKNIDEVKFFTKILNEKEISELEDNKIVTIILKHDDNLPEIISIFKNQIGKINALHVEAGLISKTKHPKEMIDLLLKYIKDISPSVAFAMVKYYPPNEVDNVMNKIGIEKLGKMHDGYIGNLIETAADPVKMANYFKDYLYKFSLAEIGNIFYKNNLDPKVAQELKSIFKKYNKDYSKVSWE